jgi:hypothetical protein
MKRRRQLLTFAVIVGFGFSSASWSIPWTTAQNYGQGAPTSSLTFVPATLTVDQGGTASAKVTVALRGANGRGTTLKAWEIPAGMTISFSPDTGNPPFMTTMSVKACPNAKSGPYSVKVQATGGAPSDVTSYTVTIEKTGGTPPQSTPPCE